MHITTRLDQLLRDDVEYLHARLVRTAFAFIFYPQEVADMTDSTSVHWQTNHQAESLGQHETSTPYESIEWLTCAIYLLLKAELCHMGL